MGFLNLTNSRLKQLEENQGKVINLTNIVNNISEILNQEYGMALLANNESQALVNKFITYKSYNNANHDLDGNTPGILTYFL